MNLKPGLICVALGAFCGCGQSDGPQPPGQATNAAAQPKPAAQESANVSEPWPFAERENTAVISLTRIIKGAKPILYVVHDADGDWQFLDGDDVSEADAATVSLKNIADHDPSVKALADLPTGWAAERADVGQEWKRFQH